MDRFFSFFSGVRLQKAFLGFAVLSAVGLFFTLIFASFFHFDFTDEGYSFYVLTQGSLARFLSPFYLLGHTVGALWGHGFLGYRLFQIFLTTLSTGLMAWFIFPLLSYSQNRYARVLLVFSLLILSFSCSTIFIVFSYNHLAVFSLMLWIIAVGQFQSRQKWLGAMLAVAVILAFFSRPPFGVFLAGFSVLYLVYRRYTHGLLVYMGAGALLALVFLGMFFPVWVDLFSLVSVQVQTSHHGIFTKDLGFLAGFFSVALAISGVFWGVFVFRRSYRIRCLGVGLAVVYFTAVLIMQGVFRYGEGELRHSIMIASTVVPMVVFIERRDWQLLRYSLFFWVLALAAVLGTNTNVFTLMTVYSLSVFILPLHFVLDRLTEGFSQYKRFVFPFLGVLWMMMGVIVVHNTLLGAYRNAPGFLPSQVSRLNPAMQYIHLEPTLAKNLDELKLRLVTLGFDFQRDGLFAYPDLPGYISGVGARSFGSSWNSTGYPREIEGIEAYLKLEPIRPFRDIYILKGVEFSGPLLQCLDRYLVPDPARFGRYAVGDPSWHYRNDMPIDLVLEGPYKLRSNP